MPSLLAWFKALSQREQRLVSIGGIVAGAILLFGALMPLERGVAAADQRIAAKQADLAWISSVEPQLTALRTSTPHRGGESLVALSDRVARDTGIARGLASQQASDGTLSVHIDQVAFDAFAKWAGTLTQQYGVHLVSANIDSAAAAGVVSATIVLRAP